MITTHHMAFAAELKALMKKHGVSDISADDHFVGYSECGQDIRITAEFNDLSDLDMSASVRHSAHSSY